MKVRNLGSNQTEVNVNGVLVLVSYSTPVAAYVSCLAPAGLPRGHFKTSKKWSQTTSRHINKWYSGDYEEKDQQWFENLFSGV